MDAIIEQYDRLARRTGRPCYSVSFWRTVEGRWGARAGVGLHVIKTKLEDAIEAAVTNAISAQHERSRSNLSETVPSPKDVRE